MPWPSTLRALDPPVPWARCRRPTCRRSSRPRTRPPHPPGVARCLGRERERQRQREREREVEFSSLSRMFVGLKLEKNTRVYPHLMASHSWSLMSKESSSEALSVELSVAPPTPKRKKKIHVLGLAKRWLARNGPFGAPRAVGGRKKRT